MGKAALIAGDDSGIGPAVAIAFAREGADFAIAYLQNDEGDARQAKAPIVAEGRKALLLPT
ncbi:hypothetical protein [Acidisoma silvae]|uniref:SDR family NAD(P)-dependent oxidoreductase n=1 Tax=Acidisoma silvae TaxID=2802396 RepID=A0A963YY86_9PROT|nr:hypothetical protein [Acidisoma silvae]MCB8878435.1 hypothetical protein [Acidisoma silvae]